jgi:hypothetical protein
MCPDFSQIICKLNVAQENTINFFVEVNKLIQKNKHIEE